MPGQNPVFITTLQKEIDDLRERSMALLPGRKRRGILARADALEITMKAFSWAASPALQRRAAAPTKRGDLASRPRKAIPISLVLS